MGVSSGGKATKGSKKGQSAPTEEPANCEGVMNIFVDGDDADDQAFGGGSGNFSKKGITKDHETGEIIGWEEFFAQIQESTNGTFGHDSRIDADTMNQIQAGYEKNTKPSY